MPDNRRIDSSWLPVTALSQMEFLDSSFFQHHGPNQRLPEVYGWRVHDDQVFIYMQLIQGQALIDQWDSLSISDKMVICDQLRGIVTSLRSVEQNPDDMFIGMLWNP